MGEVGLYKELFQNFRSELSVQCFKHSLNEAVDL